MNVRGLKAFLAVVECESVTEAGNRVGLTQSGGSRQIAALEDEVGFALFDRHRGRLRLSRKGQAFMRHARNALETLEQLPQAARTIATGAADRLEIAATSAVVHGLLPRVVANYIQLRPGLPPSIVMRSLNQIIELGPTDRFDLVILPSPLRPTALTLLGTISFDLQLAAPHHLVPELCADQPLEDVAGLPFISLDPFETYQGKRRAGARGGAHASALCL